LTPRRRLALVYQRGLANAFDVTDSAPERLRQDAYLYCEAFCRGALYAGHEVEVYHCDLADDIALAPRHWLPGPGPLWRKRKHLPRERDGKRKKK
jgi:hypothetical protein